MESGYSTGDPNLLLQPLFCLSPEYEDSKNMTHILTEPSLDTFDVYEEGNDCTSLLTPLDLLDLVLPPTPADSRTSNSDIEQSQDVLEEKDTESTASQKITINENMPGCLSGVEEPLRSSFKQLSQEEAKEMPTVSFQMSSPSTVLGPANNLSAHLLGTHEQLTFDSFSNQRMEAHKPISFKSSTIDPTSQQNDRFSAFAGSGEPDQCSNQRKEKKTKNALKFPPCVICAGKASGSHYGAITCEACKGFFRRYLLKKIEYKCTKGGNCEIKSCNKGNLNCSGCRLKKCLTFGMSKDKSKMGRYTLTKRTEAIIHMNKLEGKGANDTAAQGNENPEIVDDEIDISNFNPDTELLKAHVIQNVKNLNRSKGFNDMLVSELIEAFDAVQADGGDVKTKEQLEELHKLHSERYKQKEKLFGPMKAVPKDEYNKLYEEFGIDIDGRMADMKIQCEQIDNELECYYNFAKHIPGFYCLPVEDQLKLLKLSMHDFYSVVMIDFYSEEHQTFIDLRNGQGYHLEEVIDREFSQKYYTLVTENCKRWQGLALRKDEKALIAALTLVTADRCKLKNETAVEKIQLALTDLLQVQLQKNCNGTAHKRFTKIIDALVFTRDLYEIYVKENNILCKDELMLKEFPFIGEFVVEEND